jgi:hypothetical protein
VVRVHHLVADLVQADSLSRVVKAPAAKMAAGEEVESTRKPL